MDGNKDLARTMKNAYIKFLTPGDRTLGFQALSERAPIIALDDGIFCVALASLQCLIERDIPYTLVPFSEVDRARRRTWHFALVRRPSPDPA